jgi:hypothetical protein
VKTATHCGSEEFAREPGYEYQAGLWGDVAMCCELAGAEFTVYPIAGPISVTSDPTPPPDAEHTLVDLSACKSAGAALYRWTAAGSVYETTGCQLRGIPLPFGEQTVRLTVVSGHGVTGPPETLSITVFNPQASMGGACNPFTLDVSSCLSLIPAISSSLGFARPPDFVTLSLGASFVVGGEFDGTVTCDGTSEEGLAFDIGLGIGPSAAIGLGWVGNPLSSAEPTNADIDGFVAGNVSSITGKFGVGGGQLMLSHNKRGPDEYGEVLLLGFGIDFGVSLNLPFSKEVPSTKPSDEPCSWSLQTFQSIFGVPQAPRSATTTQEGVISIGQTSTAAVSSGSTVSIVGAPGSYAPGSTVMASIGSVQAFVGAVKAAEDGSVILVTEVPTYLPSGEHTLIVSGQAPDGTLKTSRVPLSLSGGPAVTVGLVTPNAARQTGGQAVTIIGTGFSTAPGGTEIDFGPGNPATNVQCPAETACAATAPPGAGEVAVTASVVGKRSPEGSKGALFSYERPTATTVISSESVAAVGEAVTFTATMTGAPRGGTVTFYDNSQPLCEDVPLSSPGIASCTTSYAQAGTHTLAATYFGGPGVLGSASSAITQTISEKPPVNTAAPAISGTLGFGQTLSCSAGAWSHSPTSYAYHWERDGAGIGANGSTYIVQLADQGHNLTCVVTATNLAGSATATSPSVAIPLQPLGPTAPTNIAAPAISGTPQVRRTLSCSQGAWSGAAPFVYGYVWSRDGNSIAGAGGSTYAVTPADEGHVLTCTVSATDLAGSASTRSGGVRVPRPLTLTLSAKAVRLARLLTRGLPVSVSCSLACKWSVLLSLAPLRSHLAELGDAHHKKSITRPLIIGTARGSLGGAGTITVTIQVTAKAKAKLRHAKRVKITLSAGARDTAGGSAHQTAAIALKR